MTHEEKKKYIKWIKERYPVGTEVWDDSRSGPIKVRKDSIFEAFEDEPADGIPTEITFTVRQPGKYTSRWKFEYVPIHWIK